MSRKLKSIAEFGKEILDEVKYIQLSKTRDEFDEINTMFYVEWLSPSSGLSIIYVFIKMTQGSIAVIGI